jgi:hypothetical protein
MAGRADRPTIATMTTDSLPAPSADHVLHPRGHRVRHFARHYAEMVVAMLAGMFVLGRLEALVLPGLTLGTELAVLVMATNMAIGMGLWMRFRGHSWRGIGEMSASMYAPFIVLLVPFWTGLLGAGDLMMWGHVLMLPAMAAIMLLRPAEYAH